MGRFVSAYSGIGNPAGEGSALFAENFNRYYIAFEINMLA